MDVVYGFPVTRWNDLEYIPGLEYRTITKQLIEMQVYSEMHNNNMSVVLKSQSRETVGAIIKKVLIEAIPILYYLGKVSIKRLYQLQILKVLNDEAIQMLLCIKSESSKQLCCFKPQNL